MIAANELASMLRPHGLIVRGVLAFDIEEEAPRGQSGHPARSAALVGQAGAAYWPRFQKWLSNQTTMPDNPLDSWSREVIGTLAERVSARAVFPSDKPWLPFQQWAVLAEGLKPSPVGILIHSEYGLWHAYRGALLFEKELESLSKLQNRHPCDDCAAKPCLHTCPVEAFTAGGYDSEVCIAHVNSTHGAQCRGGGCMARNACPVGTQYRYSPEVQAFHMAAFLANNPAK